MPRRNSPNDFKEIDDLNRLDKIVFDKRNAKRAVDKKRGETDIMKNNLLKIQ